MSPWRESIMTIVPSLSVLRLKCLGAFSPGTGCTSTWSSWEAGEVADIVWAKIQFSQHRNKEKLFTTKAITQWVHAGAILSHVVPRWVTRWNTNLRHCNHFVIMSALLISKICACCPKVKLPWTVFKFGKIKKTSTLCDVIPKPLILAVWPYCFAEDDKESYKVVTRTWRARRTITCCFATLQLPSVSSLLKLPSKS